MGYGSVVGRLDPVAVGGLWLAGTALTMMMDSVELMSRDDIASSLKEIPFWLSAQDSDREEELAVEWSRLH